MQHLHPKAKWLFFWGFVLRYIVIFGFLLIWLTGFILFSFIQRIFKLPPEEVGAWYIISPFLLLLLLLGGLLVLFLFFLYLWSVWTYNNYKYQLTEDAVKIERGVIWKKYISIPYERVQNVDIYRGLLARLLGLSDLQIQTAGYSAIAYRGIFGSGLGTEGCLPGLDPHTAEELREELIKKVKGTKQGL